VKPGKISFAPRKARVFPLWASEMGNFPRWFSKFSTVEQVFNLLRNSLAGWQPALQFFCAALKQSPAVR
jgi:hypothetical protein